MKYFLAVVAILLLPNNAYCAGPSNILFSIDLPKFELNDGVQFENGRYIFMVVESENNCSVRIQDLEMYVSSDGSWELAHQAALAFCYLNGELDKKASTTLLSSRPVTNKAAILHSTPDFDLGQTKIIVVPIEVL